MKDFESRFVNKIVCGGALSVLPQIPNGVINCSISSPPYWALRDYGVDGQLGLEPTFDEYIDKLCTIYDEVKRVLRADGTCWVNLGDTYGSSGRSDRHESPGVGAKQEMKAPGRVLVWEAGGGHNFNWTLPGGVQAKSLCLIPQRFAIEMVNRGWILRNVIIWSKPNPMPSSAKDRFTVDFEYVYFFVKSKRYFFEPQYEAFLTESNAERPRMGQGDRTQYNQKRSEAKNLNREKPHSMHEARAEGIDQRGFNPLGRNKRTTWIIPTQPTPEAHFATFPEELVRPMVKAGCPRYVCKKCGKGREKVYDIKYRPTQKTNNPDKLTGNPDSNWDKSQFPRSSIEAYFKGYTDCGCNAGFKQGVVLDPFVVRAEPARSRPRKEWTIAA